MIYFCKKNRIMVTPELIGQAVIRLRRIRGLSQESLAGEAGVDRRYLSDVENGKRNLSLDVLNRLSSYFDISLASLIEMAEDVGKEFHSVEDLKQHLIDNGNEEAVVFVNPNYLSAVVGIDEKGHVVYSYERMIHFLMYSDGLSYEDAIDFIDYNTIRAIPYMGDMAPIVLYNL